MQMINGAPIAPNGRIAVTAGALLPATFRAALGYESNGRLAVSTANGAVQSWNGALSFVVGRLRAADILNGALPVNPEWNSGLPVSRLTQELVCTSTAPISQWNRGWPQAANGAVCIELTAQPVNAFDNGFDTGFD